MTPPWFAVCRCWGVYDAASHPWMLPKAIRWCARGLQPCPEAIAWSRRPALAQPAPHPTAPHPFSPQFLHNTADSPNPHPEAPQMREMSKGGGGSAGSSPVHPAPLTTENHSAGTAPTEHPAPLTHSGPAPEGDPKVMAAPSRRPVPGAIPGGICTKCSARAACAGDVLCGPCGGRYRCADPECRAPECLAERGVRGHAAPPAPAQPAGEVPAPSLCKCCASAVVADVAGARLCWACADIGCVLDPERIVRCGKAPASPGTGGAGEVPSEVQCCAFGALGPPGVVQCRTPAAGKRGGVAFCAEHLTSHDAGTPFPDPAPDVAKGGEVPRRCEACGLDPLANVVCPSPLANKGRHPVPAGSGMCEACGICGRWECPGHGTRVAPFPAVGEAVEIRTAAGWVRAVVESRASDQREHPGYVHAVVPGTGAVRLSACLAPWTFERGDWRLPAPEVGGEVPVVRCAVDVAGTDDDGDPLPAEPCGTVVTGLRCAVCEGARCYSHCRSIDHLPDAATIATGGINAPDRKVMWKVVRLPSGSYVGELRRVAPDGKVSLIATDGGPDEIALLSRLRGLAEGAPVLPKVRDYEAPAMRRLSDAEAAPHVRRADADAVRDGARYLGEIGASEERVAELRAVADRIVAGPGTDDRGDETCSEADLFDPGEWEGIDPAEVAGALAIPLRRGDAERNARGRRVASAAQAMIRSWDRCWAEFSELAGMNPRAVARCRVLHDAMVAALLAEIGGAL